jgi:hypothetical protein
MRYVWTAIVGRYGRIRKGAVRHGYGASVQTTNRAQAMLPARQEATMTDRPTDDHDKPPLVKALLLARYTLVIHNGMTVTSEGESWRLDFTGELAEIDAALQSVGIDTTKPMLAPVKW